MEDLAQSDPVQLQLLKLADSLGCTITGEETPQVLLFKIDDQLTGEPKPGASPQVLLTSIAVHYGCTTNGGDSEAILLQKIADAQGSSLDLGDSPLTVFFKAVGTMMSVGAILLLTNAEKLMLPANTPIGTRVQLTDMGNIIQEYQGPSTESVAGATISGAGTAGANGTSPVTGTSNGKNVWFSGELRYHDGLWDIYDGSYTVVSAANYPWGLTFTVADGNSPAPTVTRNDVASEANWLTI